MPPPSPPPPHPSFSGHATVLNFKKIVNPTHVKTKSVSSSHSVKFMVPNVEVMVAFLTYCKFLILAYDDRKVMSVRGTGCQ